MEPAIDHALRVLRSWHTIEFFQPYQIPDKAGGKNHHKITHSALLEQGNSMLPWLSNGRLKQLKLNPQKHYQYVLYLALFDQAQLKQISDEILGDETDAIKQMEFSERNGATGDTCFAKLYLDRWGAPDFLQFSVSTLPWSIGQLIENGGRDLSLQKYDQSCERLSQMIERISQALPLHPHNNDTKTLDAYWLNQLIIELYQWAGFTPNSQFAVALDWYEMKQNNSSLGPQSTAKVINKDDPRVMPILNSFYIEDIERVINSIGTGRAHQGILDYFAIKHKKRPDLYTQSGLAIIIEHLAPRHTPHGRWPASSKHNMSLMQQFAINTLYKQLKQGGLLSVNGPPGTGKTTLLRDIIAQNLVGRGEVLAQLSKAQDGLDSQGFLISDLCGFEMVVASSNNLAVENISKELPLFTAIGDEFIASLQKLDHFTPVANQINANKTNKGYQAMSQQELCWGLISAVLGRSNNRSRFIESFFFDKHHQEDSQIEANRPSNLNILNLWRWKKLTPQPNFQAAKADFLARQQQLQQLLAELEQMEQLRIKLTEQNDAQQLQQFLRLRAKYPDIQLPDERAAIGSQSTQLNAYYQNQTLNKLRSELFISALTLHRAWLMEVLKAEEFRQHVFDLKHPLRAQEVADPKALWQLFFMLVPVVSTTFASLGNMFKNLGAASLGWLLIDEAGQAVPQAAVGGIWRAKRTIVVGDPQQIEPVFSTPTKLTKTLTQQILVNDEPHWNPQLWSVQQLADRANTYGCELEIMGQRQWIGIPLWVHRRCMEPMFSIANTIAYDQRMIHGSSPEQIAPIAHPQAGINHWQVSQGICSDRQYQHNLAVNTLELLQKLANSPARLSDVYIITPFRAVKFHLITAIGQRHRTLGLTVNDFKRWAKNNIGTVHTFQGKENQTVILVLGCDPVNAGGAKWAASKPNLLNVAITRARRHLYVVGDLRVWQTLPYFDQLAAHLTLVQGS